MAKAMWNGAVLAQSDDVVTVEGRHYFPRAAVDDRYLESSDRRSVCPWKGKATYSTVVVDARRNEDAAWEYRQPKPAAAMVAGRMAFWRGVDVVFEPGERPPGVLDRLRRLVA
jgi:uncharacterized protein (DUF427 family)